jgi:hypothetical protein
MYDAEEHLFSFAVDILLTEHKNVYQMIKRVEERLAIIRKINIDVNT